MIIGQVNGTYEAKEERMRKYLNKVVCLVKKFREASFVQILREKNMEADALAKEASTNEQWMSLTKFSTCLALIFRR